MIVARLIRLGHSKMVIEPQVAKAVDLVALPVFDPVGQLADGGLLGFEVGDFVDSRGNALDRGRPFFQLGSIRVFMLGRGMQDSLENQHRRKSALTRLMTYVQQQTVFRDTLDRLDHECLQLALRVQTGLLALRQLLSPLSDVKEVPARRGIADLQGDWASARSRR